MSSKQSNAAVDMKYEPAYDFELFEKKKRQARPTLSVVSNPKYQARNRLSVVRLLSCAAVVVTVICVMLYSRAQLTELTAQISDQKENYQALLSENTRLRAELESKVSLRGVEDRAKELGMAKMQAYQVEYVNMDQVDEITLSGTGGEPTAAEKLELYIQSFLEYIRIK